MSGPVLTAQPKIDDEYDIIVAGGGSAGGVIAGRLAKADPSLKILVLEGGPHSYNVPDHIQPGRNAQNLLPDSTTMRYHVENGGEALGNRMLVVPTGQCMGGGSATNFTMYNRSYPSEYDDWANLYKNPGWSFNDLLPLMKKTEKYEVKPNQPTHGYDGPLKVGYGGWVQPLGLEYLDTARQVDKARGGTDDDDSNDFKTLNKYVRLQKWIGDGKRSDVAHHFLYNQHENKNLHLVANAYVKKVIFEGQRAVGVEYVWNSRFLPEADKDAHPVRAKKMVVVTSGTFGSPGVLERSGIGAPDVLKKAGVETFVDLPGVGTNYMDHTSLFIMYVADPKVQTLDPINRNEPEAIAEALKQWSEEGKGPLSTNAVDAGICFRPTAEEAASAGPEYLKAYNDWVAKSPERVPFLMILMGCFLGNAALVDPQNYFALAGYHAYPLARGTIHITSGEDPAAPVDLKSDYLEHKADVEALMFFYKYTRNIARRIPSFRGEYAPLHPAFPKESKAALIDKPLPIDAPAPEYSAEDDKLLEAWIRQMAGTTFHSMGTCAMKPREDGGVLDPKLNVYGVEGLKVADCSIVPQNMSSNTYSVALTIGEKAAAIIAEELGIKNF